jgi:NAD(P)-dependent dehydrogenase (short-subunit alcohol dehydrogenase family)
VFARADVADPAAIVDAVEGCAHTLGGLDVVVAAAGVEGPTALAEDLPLADWNRVLAVNATGVFLTYKAVLPHLRRAGGGALCAVASIYTFLGAADAAAYCASKGALVQLVRSLAAAHGRERIRVSCVCPGTTDTPMLAPHVATPESKRRTEEANVHGRLIRPDEIAAAIDYLVSEEAASVLGAALVIDGGLTVVR